MTYYLGEGSIQSGPFTLEQLGEQRVRPQTLVWREGFSNWIPADTVPELRHLFTAPAPPADEPGGASGESGVAPAGASAWPPEPVRVQPLGYDRPQVAHAANGMAITALVLGILACSFSLFFCFPVSIPLGILALIFGAKGRVQAIGAGMALAGMITGGIGLALGVVEGILLLAVG